MTRFIAWVKAFWPAVFWLAVWQLAAMMVGQRLLLVSPLEALVRFMELLPTTAFWRAVLFSLSHILAGFALASLCAVALACLSARFSAVESLLAPLLAVIRSVPVASFIIVALIWVPSFRLSILISFLIVLPVVYSGTLTGIRNLDPKLSEMAWVFCLSPFRRFLYLWLPAALPELRASLAVAMGLAWKSGVAAEIIGIPSGSIGEKLYKAKLYLTTPDLFAWTFAIVLLSRLCERLLAMGLNLASRRLERM